MSTTLVDVRGQLDERRAKLKEVFEQAGGDMDMSKVTALDGSDSKAKVEQIRALNAEIDDLAKQVEEHNELEGIKGRVDDLGKPLPHPGHQAKKRGEEEPERKSIGELFVASDAYKGRNSRTLGNVAVLDVDLKAALFETGAGWAAPDVRGPRVVDLATRPLGVIDLLPQTTTQANALIYMEETTFTNAAVEVAEGGTKPEATLALTERNEPVRKIAVWLPVTDEQLEDVPQVQGYLNNRLGFMVRQRLDGQILVGNGTAPNLSGITDRSGIQTQALGTDAKPDAVYKAMTKIRVNAFSEPNGAVFHPNDWQDFRLLRTADGIYIWGNPADAGPERIWGLRVVQSTAMTENTALVGDFQQAELAVRKGVEIEVSNSHDTYFVENKQAVRAEMRAALAVYRPAAFATVTGL